MRREPGSATFVCELRDTGWDETLSLLEPLLERAEGWQRLTWGGPASWIASAGEQR